MIKVNGKIINQKHFPDGSLLLNGAYKDVSYPCESIIEWYYENDAELFTLICVRKHLGNLKVTLFMPYVPNARMDRVKGNDDVFTLKYFCETINSLNFREVRVLDVHSHVTSALLDRVLLIKPTAYINSALDGVVYEETGSCQHQDRMATYENLIMFYPDEGAMKRYSDISNLPYAFGVKDRDWETGDIKGLILVNKELILGKNILIVDDICSKGGTFYHSAKTLKDAGAKNIYLYITHCENTIFDGELLKNDLIKKIYTTNSIFTKEHERIKVIKI